MWKDILAAIWIGMILPGIILQVCVLMERRQPETAPEGIPEKAAYVRMIALRRTADGTREELQIGQYLTGVLLAEMPAAFEEEALKAQSVAARTYTMKVCTAEGKHGDGSLCDDSGCCQGYISEEAYLAGGGTQESIEKVKQAVEDTAPLVLMYEGDLIEAVYFSSSGGMTESAQAVWGTDFPYLQSVASPGEKAAAYQERTVTITPERFASLLGVPLNGPPEEWFSNVTYTEGGGVERMVIGSTAFTGVQLRGLLKLPSTAFSFNVDGRNITVTSSGYGHRVGLSQYGANAMAENGSTFPQILAHYYPGTVLVSME